MAQVPRNPYAAPAQPLTAPTARIHWRRTSLIACAWLLAASTVAGLLTALRTGMALSGFGAQERMSPIVAIEAFRGGGAHIAATAAALGAFAGAHDHLSRREGRAFDVGTGAVFAAVPPATLVAACLMTAWAVVVASIGFDVTAERSWLELQQLLEISDPLVALGKGCAFALVTAIVIAAVAPWIARKPYRLILKLVMILIVARTTTSVVGVVIDLSIP